MMGSSRAQRSWARAVRGGPCFAAMGSGYGLLPCGVGLCAVSEGGGHGLQRWPAAVRGHGMQPSVRTDGLWLCGAMGCSRG
jgi:hypothetical protein